jgi:hypothetical protein
MLLYRHIFSIEDMEITIIRKENESKQKHVLKIVQHQ